MFAKRWKGSPTLEVLSSIEGYLSRIQLVLQSESRTESAAHARAAEWFLDNYFFVQRTVRQIRRDMPRKFYAQLSRSAENPKAPRIAALAIQLLLETDLLPDRQQIEEFVEREQATVPLSIAELWALPAFLRIGALEQLVGALRALVPQEACPLAEFARQAGPARTTPEDRVAASIRTFRLLDSIDWKDFFQATSLVERVLRDDIGQVYQLCDFATQDRYRKVIERIARRVRRDELEVARAAIDFAQRAAALGGPHGHVGYYLVDRGLRDLEQAFGYRPPVDEAIFRRLTSKPTFSLLFAIGLAVSAAMLLPAWYLAQSAASGGQWLLGMTLTLVPASTLGITVVHWMLTNLLPPRVLPKLDFRQGIPSDSRTLIVVPCLLGSAAEVRSLVRELEIHYLSNPDPNLRFALLSDYIDADQAELPADHVLLSDARSGVRLLNLKYGVEGSGPFHLLHRGRRWNPSEGVWMGWERKRGKLEQLNAHLLGRGAVDAFECHLGNPDGLRDLRYVITLDSGTLLPRNTAARLVGILAHPLNRVELDSSTQRVTRGFGVIQPRVEISPMSSSESVFTRMFAGDAAIDIYTRAVSDVYQDLCGEGLYVGKGIYDLRSFHISLEGRVPENALVSHDHFEGLHARVALASDVVLYEDYPPQYLAYARRMHRWIRGDWQLLPWLSRRARSRSGAPVRNDISWLHRWILFDNLRRSLLAPALVLLLASGWLWLPGNPQFWTAIGLLAPAGHVFTGLVSGVIRGPRRSQGRRWAARLATDVRETVGRWVLYIVFLVHEALLVADAISRTLTRLLFTHRNFLQWRTAAHTATLLSGRGGRSLVWAEMIGSPLLALALAAAIWFSNPIALPVALPFLALWIAAPEIARRISKPIERAAEQLDPPNVQRLRLLARRTWFFFENFVGPGDQWLPPDNYQEFPRGEIAHRTSPTNIGMLLTSTVIAGDLGYLGPAELAHRLRNTFETIDRMEHHAGHLLNWYDTRTLDPLPPRYVSTVDSGNLAAALLVVEQACAQAATTKPVLGPERWSGLVDALDLFEVALRRLVEGNGDWNTSNLLDVIGRVRTRALIARDQKSVWISTLRDLSGHGKVDLDRELLQAIANHQDNADPARLREVRLWLECIHQHLRSMERDVELIAPWIDVLEDFELDKPAWQDSQASGDAWHRTWQELRTTLTLPESLAKVTDLRRRAATALEALLSPNLLEQVPELFRRRLEDLRVHLEDAFEEGARNALKLQQELLGLGVRAERQTRAMDFGMLYDQARHLLHIGFNATTATLDSNHYDLLASEARIASFLAIAKGDIPTKHWFYLGRPLTHVGGRTLLLSWGATMFEYLMPSLLMESKGRTLLASSARAAVDIQIDYGKRHQVPWGISESGFYRFDVQSNYQYRSFGVPGLGLRRGLDEDLVVAPYASMLGLNERPTRVMQNLTRFEKLGALGTFGLFEAVDFTPERIRAGRSFALVQSYMAHHQGMVLAAVGNYLCEQALVRRFHASSLVQAAELLLHEQMPIGVSRELHVSPVALERPATREPSINLESWRPKTGDGVPQIHLLSNGRWTSAIGDGGSGWCSWNGLALTRWTADEQTREQGTWIYVRDEDVGSTWSATRLPTNAESKEQHVIFHPHRAEFQRRDHGILLRTEVVVAPHDDVEIRLVTVVNESDRERRLSLTSCCEPVLAEPGGDLRHPAFSKLFVETSFQADSGSLSCSRNLRSDADRPAVLLQRWVADAGKLELSGFETDRARFLGRWGSYKQPNGLDAASGLSGAEGHTLDPLLALQGKFQLEAGATLRLALVSVAAGSRLLATQIADRYRSLTAIDWVLQDAATDGMRELSELRVDAGLLPHIQRLTSLVLHPRAGLRGSAEAIESNRLGMPALWRHGISGDLPIVLLRLDDTAAPILISALAAHRLWHHRGLLIDLVVQLSGPSTYGSQDAGRVHEQIDEHGSSALLNCRGGIFLVHDDQLPAEERQLIEVAASVVLDAARGDLSAQFDALEAQPDHPASLVASLSRGQTEATKALERPIGLRFDNGLGGFTEEGREYVIHLEAGVRTPAPWCNVLSNPYFGCLLSEAGLGYSWSLNASQRRLTPWHNDPVCDKPAAALYLRDEETGEFWTTTPLPAGRDQTCTIRHGAGFTEYHQRSHSIAQHMRVWVPRGASLQVVEMRLENLTQRPRRLTLSYFAELVLGETRAQSAAYMAHEFDEQSGALLARNPWKAEFAERVSFLCSNETTHSVTVDRTEFLGRAQDLARPEALSRWGFSGCVRSADSTCHALMVHVELGPRESRRVWFVFGEAEDRATAIDLVRRYRQSSTIDADWNELREFWERQLDTLQVRTPDPAMDILLNRWLPYQSIASRIEARTGFYQSSGAFGFRDQLQDVMALVHSTPDRMREHLLLSAAHQFEAGDVLHWWHPPSEAGVRTRCSDDLVWLAYATAHYVRATGDRGVLDENITFLDGDPLRKDEHERYTVFTSTSSKQNLLEHCRRALDRASTLGAHGLPLIGAGDWNDGMNRVGDAGRGESVWLAWFLIATMVDFAWLLEEGGSIQEAESWRARAERLRNNVETAGWSGDWYLRAWYDDGTALADGNGTAPAIDLIAQAWAALSGAGSPQRVQRALDSAEERLVDTDRRLACLLWPPFGSGPTDQDAGYIQAYPPGVRENGGQYTHAAAWLGLAHAANRDGVRAERLFRLLNPILRTQTPEQVQRYRVEPYVLAADVYSVDPHIGRGGWTWYTGSAAWTWRLGVEGILGIRRESGNLRIDPCIPCSWESFEVIVRTNDCECRILVVNPGRVSCGVAEILLDGERLPSAIVPLSELRGIHQVRVTMSTNAKDEPRSAVAPDLR